MKFATFKILFDTLQIWMCEKEFNGVLPNTIRRQITEKFTRF